MLEAVLLWVETHALLLSGLAALLTISILVWRIVAPRLVEKVIWWRLVVGYLFMRPQSQKIMLLLLEQVKLLPFDQHSRAVRLVEQYYQIEKKDRKAFLGNLREEDRAMVQRFVDKADAVIFADAINEIFDENGKVKEKYQHLFKRS